MAGVPGERVRTGVARRRLATWVGVVVVVGSLAGCGVGTVDPDQEAEVLVATCRSWLARQTAGTGIDVDDVPIDAAELEAALRREPGGDERSVAGTTRDRCIGALRQTLAEAEAGGDGRPGSGPEGS